MSVEIIVGDALEALRGRAERGGGSYPGIISMTTENRDRLPRNAVGLRLARIDRSEQLILCESIRFDAGFDAVETTLRRAAISGRVDVAGAIENHFADVLDDNGDIIETVALDRRSYSALKNRWMRCRVELP